MPVGNWKRFKLAFFNSRSEKAQAWTGIAERTLRMARDAATALKEIEEHESRADEILHRLTALDKAVAEAKEAYSKATENTVKDAQIEILNTMNTEGEALLAEAQRKLRAKGAAAIVGLTGGKQILDDMMSEIDWSADRDADEAFGVEALKARFQIDTVKGDLGHVSLPKLYDLLSKLPDSHTRTNDMLKSVKRETPLFAVGGLYSTRDKEIVIVSKFSAGIMGKDHGLDADDEVADEHMPKPGSVKLFSHVTLHEVGHAYDHSVGFMKGKMGQAEYGNWKSVGKDTLARIWGDEKGFYTDAAFATLPPEFLVEYLEWELEHGDKGATAQAEWQKRVDKAGITPDATTVAAQPQVAEAAALYARYEDTGNTEDVWPTEESQRKLIADEIAGRCHQTLVRSGWTNPVKVAWGTVCQPAIRKMLIEQVAPQTAIAQVLQSVNVYAQLTPNWTALKNHEASKILRAFANAGAGFWKQGAEGASKYTIGTTVYTVDSGGSFYSYDAAARAFSVSKYQWHAPAEWFAELYAFYFAGRLKDTAKHVKLFLKDLGEPFVV